MGAEANGGSRGAACRAECPAVLAGHVGLVPMFAESLSGRAEGCRSRSGHGHSVPLAMEVGLPEPCHPPLG